MKHLRSILFVGLLGVLVLGLVAAPTTVVLAQTALGVNAGGTVGVGGTNVSFGTGMDNTKTPAYYMGGTGDSARIGFGNTGVSPMVEAGQMTLGEIFAPGGSSFTNLAGYNISSAPAASVGGKTCATVTIKNPAGVVILSTVVCK